jgi:hypothetical protein
MDLNQMRALVRHDLHDEDASAYRWTATSNTPSGRGVS